MEKKLRIQLFAPDGAMVSDRLVSQETEFYKGPEEKHNGPIRIEFTLTQQDDIDAAKLYLDKVVGMLPIEAKIKKSKKVSEAVSPDKREEFLDLLLSVTGDQDKFISNLREHDFVFLTTEHLASLEKVTLNVKDAHAEKFQWMIRLLKRANNPMNDRYDPSLVFGISLMDERNEKVVIYKDQEFFKSIKVPVPEKPRETFKKSGMVKFPHYMTQDERDKFRIETRLLQNDKKRQYSKFFKRWLPYVENLPDLSREEENKTE